ncbi:hypothetical protein ACJX0J_019444, partial [Zea mays]
QQTMWLHITTYFKETLNFANAKFTVLLNPNEPIKNLTKTLAILEHFDGVGQSMLGETLHPNISFSHDFLYDTIYAIFPSDNTNTSIAPEVEQSIWGQELTLFSGKQIRYIGASHFLILQYEYDNTNLFMTTTSFFSMIRWMNGEDNAAVSATALDGDDIPANDDDDDVLTHHNATWTPNNSWKLLVASRKRASNCFPLFLLYISCHG